MSYSLDMLFAKPPSEKLIVPYDNPNYPVVFIARWPGKLFDSHGDFIRHTELFDTAMQGFLQGMSPDVLAKWFEPHDIDAWPSEIDVPVLRNEDAVEWMRRNHPHVFIPWLYPGDHSDVLYESDGTFAELTAYGRAGYLCVFVADLLPLND